MTTNEADVSILEDLVRVRNLGLEYNRTARFGGRNLDDIPLQEFLSGHIVGLEIFSDNLRSRLKISNPELHKSVNWDKVNRMARYHDLVELEKGKDIPCPVKTKIDREEEHRRTNAVVEAKVPLSQQEEVKGLLQEYHEQDTLESKLLKLFDKIHPHIYFMEDRYIEALLFTHSLWGISNRRFQEDRHTEIVQLLNELGISELQELYEVVWEKNVELGILGEHPQEFMDLRVETKVGA